MGDVAAQDRLQGILGGQESVAVQQMGQGQARAEQAMAAQAVGRGSNPLAQRAAVYAGGQMSGQMAGQAAMMRAQELQQARMALQQQYGQGVGTHMGLAGLTLQQKIAAEQARQGQQELALKKADQEYQQSMDTYGAVVGTVGSVVGGAAGSDERLKKGINHINERDQDEMLATLGFPDSGGDQMSKTADELQASIGDPGRGYGPPVMSEADLQRDIDRGPRTAPENVEQKRARLRAMIDQANAPSTSRVDIPAGTAESDFGPTFYHGPSPFNATEEDSATYNKAWLEKFPRGATQGARSETGIAPPMSAQTINAPPINNGGAIVERVAAARRDNAPWVTPYDPAGSENWASKYSGGSVGGSGGGIGASAAGQYLGSDEKLKRGVNSVSPQEQDKALRSMEARRFEYTPKARAQLGLPGGVRPGITAQELERSKLGDEITVDTPMGKGIDRDAAIGTTLGLLGRLDERLRALEGGKRGLSESELRAAENQALDTLHRSEPGGAYQPGSDLAGSGRASVQAPPSAEDNLRRAKEHFAAARSAADDGNHELAARLFQAAQEYSPHPSTAYNASRASQLARGQEEQGRLQGASQLYDEGASRAGAEQHDQAERSFRQAYDLSPDPDAATAREEMTRAIARRQEQYRAERASEEARASAMYEAEMTRRVQESAALSMPPSNYAPMAGRLAELRQGYQGAMQR